jgi:hypothetical protein
MDWLLAVESNMEISHMGENAPTYEEAKKSLSMCWVFTGVNTILLIAPFSTAGIFGVIIAPFLGWSLYWGWGPVWRRWRNFFAGWGFISDSWILWIIVVGLFFEIPVLIAIVSGAITGIGKYKQAKQIVESHTR